MTEKRFERIYADVDVFCRDHNAKGISQLLEKEDYDTIVDLLNEQHEEIDNLKLINKRANNEYIRQRERVKRLHKDWDRLYQHLVDTGLMTEEEILKVIE